MGDKNSEKLNQMKTRRLRVSLAGQVAFFFFFATLITGVISFFALRTITDHSVRQQKEELSRQIVMDIAAGMLKYPAIEIVFAYWIEHAEELDVEYYYGDQTRAKETWLGKRHPNLVMNEASEDDFLALSENDQKVFAEVMYTYVLQDYSQLKELYDVDFVFAMTSDDQYQKNTYILSGAPSWAPRSRNYGDAYLIGTTVDCTPELAAVLMDAQINGICMQKTKRHLNCYYVFGDTPGGALYLGVSFDLEKHVDAVRHTANEGVFIFLLMQIVLSGICLVLLFIFTIRPIRRIQRRVRDYKDSKDSERILRHLAGIRSGNELGELKDDISEYVMQIDDYMQEIRSITSEQERIRTELSVATKIQSDRLPKNFPPFPGRHEFDLFATMTPAKEVGGDFYDFFLIDEDHLAMVIADVSGKGVPAALFMITAMTLIRNRAHLGGGPGEILASVNNRICEGNESGFFVTVWLAIIEISTGKGVSVNAGHEHPAILHRGVISNLKENRSGTHESKENESKENESGMEIPGSERRTSPKETDTSGCFELVRYHHSPAVATMEDLRFREREFRLQPGDRLFVYTDGVTEATNRDKELFGEKRLLTALNREPGAELKVLLENVKKDIDAFVDGAEQFDDYTMLVLDYFGK